MGLDRKADRIADDLLGQIVSGELAVGALLPTETELAATYAVNRSVVREAIKKLEVHRLVQPVRRRGTVVLDPLASPSPEVVRAMLNPPGRGVDRAFLADLLEVRAHLDLQLTELAARNRTDADLGRLRELVDAMEASLGQPARYAELLKALGFALARASGNCLYEMLMNWQRHITDDLESLFAVIRLPNPGHIQGYRMLLEAIERRDTQVVRELVTQYHAWATARLLDAVGGASKEGNPWIT